MMLRAQLTDTRFGVRVFSTEATGTISLPAVPTAQPMTLYVVTATGTAGHRSAMNGAPGVAVSAGRTSSGNEWFAQTSVVSGVATVAFAEAAGPQVLAAVRDRNLLLVDSLTGSASSGVTGWPPDHTLVRAVIDSTILHTELWVGTAHDEPMRQALMASLEARFL